MSLFKIKYCGFKSLGDVRDAVESGAEAIGLNFFADSPRFIEPSVAAEISVYLQSVDVRSVGVFVDASRKDIEQVVERVQLDFVQLHGSESPDDFGHHGSSRLSRPVIKALPYRGAVDVSNVFRWTNARDSVGLVAFLVDAYDPVQHGGTGKRARWDLLNPRPSCFGELPLVLAGGLTSENVGQAQSIATPDAVDAASGIEDSPGKKSKQKMLAFVRAAKAI
jgi:phosphoribosylanthranilate isomerase